MKFLTSQDWSTTSFSAMTTLSSTRKLFQGSHIVRFCVRKGGLWNIRVTETAPGATRSKLDKKDKRISNDMNAKKKKTSELALNN